MKLLARSLAVTALAAGALVATQRAEAQVAVDVDISLGGITILYYHDNINVNVPTSVLATLLTPGCAAQTYGASCVDALPTGLVNATNPAAGVLSWPGAVTGQPVPATLNAIALNLENVWAVRAIGGTGPNTTVTVALGADATITSAGSGSIVVTNPRITATSSACAGAAAVTFLDPGLVNAQQGSVCLNLDLTGVTGQGPFDGGSDTNNVVYTLQVTGT